MKKTLINSLIGFACCLPSLSAAQGFNLDEVLGGINKPAVNSVPGSGNSMDALLSGVNEEIDHARLERARQAELVRLAEEQSRLQEEIVLEQQRVASVLKRKVLQEKRRREEEQDSGLGKAFFGAALGYAVGSFSGLDGVGRVEMATEYMQAVYSDNPAAIQAATGRITNDYIQRRSQQLQMAQQREKMLKSGQFDVAALVSQSEYASNLQADMPGGTSSFMVKPAQMPTICQGYTRENYATGGIVGDVQIDSYCQQAMHYYDMYAANAGHPDAKPQELEKAYQAHLKSAALAEQFSTSIQSSARFSNEPVSPSVPKVRDAEVNSPTPPAPPPECAHGQSCSTQR